MLESFILTALRHFLDVYDALWWWAPAMMAGCLLLCLNAFWHDRKWRGWIFAVASLPGAIALAMHFGLSPLAQWLVGREIYFPDWHEAALVGQLCAGTALAVVWLRMGVQTIDRMMDRFSVRTGLERDKKTDIRHIDKVLPGEIGAYNPTRYFKPKKGIFVGLDSKRRPIYCSTSNFDESHLLLCGRTRSGKGVAAQIIGAQSIRRGELFVVLDPKFDAWMPSVFAAEASAAGQAYVFVDLRQSAPPQINPFEGADAEEVENLLLAAFSLSERGEAADYYRVGDRRAALECARLVIEMRRSLGRTPTPAEIMGTELAAGWKEAATNFWGYMLEMAELPAVNGRHGLSLDALHETGGCLYIVGDMQNARIVRMQRLFLLRLMQLAKKRAAAPEPSRVIRVFADEFTVHVSRPFLMSLAASAGWRLCVILAFQTIGDLADCPSDLTPEAVKAKVWENCALKLLYAVRDSDTAEWLARSTGTIQVDDETRRVDRNIALSESVATDRTLRQSETYLVDVNMLLGLPKGCGVLFGTKALPEFCYTSPVPAERDSNAVTVTYAEEATAEQNKSIAASMVALN